MAIVAIKHRKSTTTWHATEFYSLPTFIPISSRAIVRPRDMNFGFGVGDIITISRFACKIYKSCDDAAEDFRNISDDIRSMQFVLEETQDLIDEYKQSLGPKREFRLFEIRNGCYRALRDLEKLLEKHRKLANDNSRKRDKIKWVLEDIPKMKERVSMKISLLTSFNSVLTRYVLFYCVYKI
jgi:hypothetical protein